MNAFESVALVLVVIAFLIYRQVVPRKLSRRGLLIVPVILLYFLVRSMPDFHPDTAKTLDLVLSSAVSVVLGLLATRQLHVYASPDTGKAMASGSLTYFLWWLAAFAIKAALAVALGETAASAVTEVDILVPVFLLVATRNVYLYWCASRLGLDLH